MSLTKNDLSAIKGIVQKEIRTETRPIKNDIKIIKKDLKTTINFFDKENLGLKNRMEKIELKVGIASSEF